MRRSAAGRSLVFLLATAALVVACAAGSQVEAGDAAGLLGTDGSTTVDAAHEAGTSHRHGDASRDTGGSVISLDAAQADSGTDAGGLAPGSVCSGSGCAPPAQCTTIGSSQYCIEVCPAKGCPDGTYCSEVAGTDLCLPYLNQECDICTSSSSCKLPTDACLTSPLGEKFCARDCSIDPTCPTGYVCQTPAEYLASAPVTPTGDGGAAGDAGGSGSGSSGGSASSASSSSAGGGGADAAVEKWCVPANGGTCACSSKNNGATETCTVTNSYGTCSAPATCDGTTGKWVGCPAAPTMEICNGKDDNCNGQIDEGNPDQLCAFVGAPPPNASWACTNGMCVLGACDPGWTDFPPGPASAGCACPVNATEPDSTCATAAAVGTIADNGQAPLVIKGTLSSATDVDVYTFNTTDVIQATTDTYNVSIKFTAPAPNNEFLMDVIRGSPCSDTPTGASTDIQSYDWCVNGMSSDGTTGELACGPMAANHCMDESSVYFLRVHRPTGVMATCTPYEITINASGATCDMTQQCQ